MINRFLQIGLETGNKKPFWKYLRVQKQEDFGISALKSNRTLFTDRKPISEILNTQFKSVFTKTSKIPQMSGTSFPSINGLNITEIGVFKLLDKIDVSKASGPDCFPGRILQNLARELAPVLHYIFDQSLNSGDLPADWTLANVAPIFKKGSKLQAVNYRPVSLTCIRYQKDAKTVVSFYFTKLSTIWLWYHIHVWKRLMCVQGKNILKSSATSVTTLTHMDNRSFLTVLVRGMALQKTLQRPTL